MNHNDIVRQSFKKQAEKIVAYHMSKVEYTDYLIQKIAATGEEHALEVAAGTGNQTCRRKSYRKYLLSKW